MRLLWVYTYDGYPSPINPCIRFGFPEYYSDGNLIEYLLACPEKPEIYHTRFDYLKTDGSLKAALDLKTGKILYHVDANRFFDMILIRGIGRVETVIMNSQALKEKISRLDLKIPMLNSKTSIVTFMDKYYLKDLAKLGYPVPETGFTTEGEGFMDLVDRFFSRFDRCVFKPLAGFGGKGVDVVTRDDIREQAFTKGLTTPLVIQEFIPEIQNGEKSLFFIGARFLYAVLKIPRPCHYLTNHSYRKSISRYVPSREELSLACSMIQTLELNADIIRIDLVGEGNSMKIIEISGALPSFYTSVLSGMHEIADPLMHHMVNLIRHPIDN